MNKILAIAQANQQRAINILNKLKIVETWAAHGAKANLVGSVATGLLMKSLDIDLHIYSDKFTLEESFAAIADIAKSQGVTEVTFKNLLDTDEACVEWHVWYKDELGEMWHIDLIHIIKNSRYDGYFENVAAQIAAALTPETKLAILTIKNDTPDNIKIMGIEIYKAVLQHGIRTYDAFIKWREANPPQGIVEW